MPFKKKGIEGLSEVLTIRFMPFQMEMVGKFEAATGLGTADVVREALNEYIANHYEELTQDAKKAKVDYAKIAANATPD